MKPNDINNCTTIDNTGGGRPVNWASIGVIRREAVRAPDTAHAMVGDQQASASMSSVPRSSACRSPRVFQAADPGGAGEVTGDAMFDVGCVGEPRRRFDAMFPLVVEDELDLGGRCYRRGHRGAAARTSRRRGRAAACEHRAQQPCRMPITRCIVPRGAYRRVEARQGRAYLIRRVSGNSPRTSQTRRRAGRGRAAACAPSASRTRPASVTVRRRRRIGHQVDPVWVQTRIAAPRRGRRTPHWRLPLGQQ